MQRLSIKLKVAAGYICLTLLFFISIGYIYHEMQSMSQDDESVQLFSKRRKVTHKIINNLYQAEITAQSVSAGDKSQIRRYRSYMKQTREAIDSLAFFINDSVQLNRLDTVRRLLDKKEINMNDLLYAMDKRKESSIYAAHIDKLIEEQDSLLKQNRVHRKNIVHRNSYSIQKKRKGVLKRIAEVFSPGKSDTIKVDNVIVEQFTDTLAEAYNPVDTVITIFRDMQSEVADKHVQAEHNIEHRAQSLRINGFMLGQKVNQLLTTIENDLQQLSEQRYEQQRKVITESATTITIIAISAVVLALLFLVIIWRDIARSNHYRRELEKAKKCAEDLLEAREQLMLTITHDIKGPVGSVIGYSQLLKTECTDRRQKLFIENMESASKHLLALVNSLLDFHKLDVNKMDVNTDSFNVELLFSDIYKAYKPIAEVRKLELKLEFSTGTDMFYIGDSCRIRQIVENLLSNAVKFTDAGYIYINVGVKEGWLNLSVKDSGCGISLDEQKLVFREFTRLKGAQGREGFGLGLTITSKLVNLLGGNISLQSEPGCGTTFYVAIPLKIVDVKDKPSEKACSNNMQVLIIDDDPIQVQLTSNILEKIGIKAQSCELPQQILDKINKECYDMIITDIQMPAMNGFDLLMRIREAKYGYRIAVIAATARRDMNEEYFISEGFDGCLYKPFTLNDLAAKVNWVEIRNRKLDFSALTLFASDDDEAARNILISFVEETKKNRMKLQESLKENDVERLAAIAHKMIPVFKMIGADICVKALESIEVLKGNNTILENDLYNINIILTETECIISEASAKCN